MPVQLHNLNLPSKRSAYLVDTSINILHNALENDKEQRYRGGSLGRHSGGWAAGDPRKIRREAA